jgi:hypothetical protein
MGGRGGQANGSSFNSTGLPLARTATRFIHRRPIPKQKQGVHSRSRPTAAAYQVIPLGGH